MSTEDALRRCVLSGALLRAGEIRRLRRRALRLALRLEAGPFWSATAREMMARWCGVRVGAYSYGGGCFVLGGMPAGTVVGRYVSIADGVRVFARNHPVGRLSMHPFFYNAALGFVERDTIESGTVEIGDDAWVGERAIITPGCRRIGVGAVVGAGAVVTKDVPDFAIVAGNPAKVLRMRFDEATCETIRRSRWWDRPAQEVVREMEWMTRELGSEASMHPLLRAAVHEAETAKA